MYVYILRDKVTGVTTAEMSRFGLVDNDERDVMFRVSTPDSIFAEKLIKDLNLEMMTFGEPDVNRVDKAIYYDVLDTRNRAYDELAKAKITVAEQAEIIRKKNMEISQFRGYTLMLENANKAALSALRGVMSALSLQTVLQSTHRERNEALRAIVRHIHSLTTKTVDEFNEPPQDMDDIPF